MLATRKVAARCVIPVRHPLAVAGSLARRDGFTAAKSVLVWSAYMLAAEAYTRDLPRAFVGYDALLGDWRAEVARIEAAHGAPLPKLSEAVRRRPYSVVLFDEIEKAHHDVFNVLLQVLDDGRLTDGQGRTVDFRNTIVIMTSNIGSPIIQEYYNSGKLDTKDHTEMERLVQTELRSHFRPEFLNRVDDIIIFHSLTEKQLGAIVDIQLRRLEKRLAQQQLKLELDSAAKRFLAKEGYDPQFGARLTGKIGGWSVGVLAMNDRTPDMNFATTDDAGGTSRALIGVARVQREIGNGSAIGFLMTTDHVGGGRNDVFSADVRLKLNPNWIFTGQATRSLASDNGAAATSAAMLSHISPTS